MSNRRHFQYLRNIHNMKIKYLIPLSIFILSLTLTSCEESGIVPTGNTVSGQIIYGGYYNESFRILSDGNETIPDEYGNFSINVSSFPYDLFIAESNGSLIWIYDDLQTTQPYINLSTDPHLFYYKNSAIFKTHLDLDYNQRVLSAFIPDNGQEKVQVTSSGSLELHNTSITWNESQSLTGRLIFLIFTMSNNGTIISYDKFYEKDITITHNMNVLDTLHNNDPFINPNESYVRGTIQNPKGPPQSTRSFLKIGFPNVYNQWTWGASMVGYNFDFVVPVGLPVELFVEGLAYENFSPSSSKSQIRVIPGSDNNQINLNSRSTLIDPVENDSIILSNAQFRWANEGGVGIYELGIGSDIKIYTSNPEVTIPDLQKLGLQYRLEQSSWRVVKFYGSATLDEFFSKEVQEKIYEGSSKSDNRPVYIYQ